MADNPDRIQTAADFAHGLADPNRLRIINLLLNGPLALSHIMEALNIKQPLASHHTGVLMNLGLLEREKQGRWRIYALRPGNLEQAVKTIHEAVYQR